MRRAELEVSSPEFFAEVAASQVGYLGLVLADGCPRSIALNFVAVGDIIYFHGALEGEKYELIKNAPAAGFTMVIPYSYIPSSWSAPRYACPATQLFKSVEIKGRCCEVTDIAEKASGLQALMEKHQPEGGYDPIDAEVVPYTKALDQVGVFKVVNESWTGKIKFGQNEPEKLRRIFVARLRERGGPMDEATALEIEKTLPN